MDIKKQEKPEIIYKIDADDGKKSSIKSTKKILNLTKENLRKLALDKLNNKMGSC